MVERDLAKVHTGVRFSVPAPDRPGRLMEDTSDSAGNVG